MMHDIVALPVAHAGALLLLPHRDMPHRDVEVEAIAEMVKNAPAFTARLLHDPGGLSMAVQEPQRYAAVARLVRNGGVALWRPSDG